jgi:hypothetical protein
MKIKECFAINDKDKSNIILFNMDNDELITLNETASFIFLNREKDIDSLKNEILCNFNNVSNETQIYDDIKETLEFIKDTLYE